MKRFPAIILSKFKNTRAQLDMRLRQTKVKTFKSGLTRNFLPPIRLAHLLSYVLMGFIAATLTYYVFRALQIPSTKDILSKNSKGIALYINQDISAAYSLFGSTSIGIDNTILRGVVITDKNIQGIYQGYALFELDGKPTRAIAVGEFIDRGILLKEIEPESATLLYKGKETVISILKTKKGKDSLNNAPAIHKSKTQN